MMVRGALFAWVGLFAMLWMCGTAQAGEVEGASPLPLPSGKYAIGRTHFDWIDSDRNRNLVVWVWYPAAISAASERTAWLPGKWQEWAAELISKGTKTGAVADLRTHAVKDAAFAPSPTEFPLLVFAPGMGLGPLQYAGVLEDLASHGYIVAGIVPTDYSFTVLADGKVVQAKPHVPLLLSPGLTPAEAGAKLAEEQRRLEQITNIWSEDLQFALTELGQLNFEDESPFKGRIDLQRIGFLGHSQGGASSLQVAAEDARVRAVVDIDGMLPGSLANGAVLAKPTMVLLSDTLPPPPPMQKPGAAERQRGDSQHRPSPPGPANLMDHTTVLRTATPGYLLRIAGSSHLFSADLDALHVSLKQASLPPAGSKPPMGLAPRPAAGIDPVRALRITSTYVLAFFDQYLLAKPSPLLEGPDKPFPEIGIERLGARASQLTDEQLVADLIQQLKRLEARDAFSGAVLLAKGERVLFEGAYGFANHAFNAPNRVDTRFNLGSMNKMFTAVATLQLVQRGKLKLDARVIDVLPDYPDPALAAKITVHQLLTHTSGLGNFFNDRFGRSSRALYRSTESHIPLFAGDALLFDPGSAWSYSNAGFIVLGLIIERVSGRSYYDYVREQIFDVLSMSHTESYNADDDVPNLALGYTYVGDDMKASLDRPRRSNILMHVGRGSASGGGYSTVGDLLRFSVGLQRHRLLNRELTQLLTEGKVATGRGVDRYAYGFVDAQYRGTRVIGHSGGFPGISARFDIYPDLGYTVVVLSNYDEAAEFVSDRLRWLLSGGAVLHPGGISTTALQALVGTYSMLPASEADRSAPTLLRIDADGAGLWLHGLRTRRFLPLSEDEFFDEDSLADRLRFEKDSQGHIIASTVTRAASSISIPLKRL